MLGCPSRRRPDAAGAAGSGSAGGSRTAEAGPAQPLPQAAGGACHVGPGCQGEEEGAVRRVFGQHDGGYRADGQLAVQAAARASGRRTQVGGSAGEAHGGRRIQGFQRFG